MGDRVLFGAWDGYLYCLISFENSGNYRCRCNIGYQVGEEGFTGMNRIMPLRHRFIHMNHLEGYQFKSLSLKTADNGAA
jgi:hypothetical protein